MSSRLRAVPDTPPRAIIYLRQSTYREESISLELQETAARDHCARMGYTVVAVEADPGVSGRTWKRPAVQRVMKSIEDGDADVLVLWRWSRLSRSRKDWAIAADRVDVAGGRIESATEPNDVTAAGRFARGVMTELAAFESERIGEQWKDVQERRRSLGLPGGGKIPYGWRYLEDGTVGPHPDQAPAIPEMYRLYLAGHGARQIGQWLEEQGYLTYSGRTSWSYNVVTGTLNSPFHAGFVVHRGELLPGSHEPLIDEETWRQFLAVRRERAEGRSVKRRYLLSGIARCATCGERMFGLTVAAGHNRSKNPYFAYRCKAVSGGRGLHGPGAISTRILDPIVLAWLEGVANDINHAAPAPAAVESHAKLDAQRIAREITAIDKQVMSLTEGLSSGLVPERAYAMTVAGLEEKRSALTQALTAAEDRIVLGPTDPVGTASALMSEWDSLPLTAKREGLKTLIDRIVVECREPRSVTIVPRWETPPVVIDV